MPRKKSQPRVKTIQDATDYPVLPSRELVPHSPAPDATLDEERLEELLAIIPSSDDNRVRLAVGLGQFAETCGKASRVIDHMMGRVIQMVKTYQLYKHHPNAPVSEDQYWALLGWDMADINRIYRNQTDIVPVLELLGRDPQQELVDMTPQRQAILRGFARDAMREMDEETKADPQKAREALQPFVEQLEVVKHAPLDDVRNLQREEKGLRPRQPFFIQLIRRHTARGWAFEIAPNQLINVETAEELDDHLRYLAWSYNGESLTLLSPILQQENQEMPQQVTPFIVPATTEDDSLNIDFDLDTAA